jgi:hypothetical protein
MIQGISSFNGLVETILAYTEIRQLMTDQFLHKSIANDKDRFFVSKYKLNLPSEEELKAFLENELRKGLEV